jgi:hypothetical protein
VIDSNEYELPVPKEVTSSFLDVGKAILFPTLVFRSLDSYQSREVDPGVVFVDSAFPIASHCPSTALITPIAQWSLRSFISCDAAFPRCAAALRTHGRLLTTDVQIGHLVNAALEAIELPLAWHQVTDGTTEAIQSGNAFQFTSAVVSLALIHD